MKKKSLLLTAAMAACALSASAQYVIYPNLPQVTPTEATDVSDYGYTANWTPVPREEYLGTDAIGYYIANYATKTAKEDGDKFYYINTDFSFLTGNGGGTVEDPLTQVSISNYIVRETLGDPYRPMAWTVFNPGYANGVLCLDGQLNQTYCNGQMSLGVSDLSVGGGDIHFKFKVKSDFDPNDPKCMSNARTLSVLLRNTSTFPNQTIDSYKCENLTNEWREVEFTLHGGNATSDILIKGDDLGNMEKMFYFIDDMQVWQELKKGETAYVLYGEDVVKDNMKADNIYFTTGDLFEGEQYAYTVSTYSVDGHSLSSSMVFVGGTETAIDNTTAAEGMSADTPVTVYNLSGQAVAHGTVGNMPAMPKGAMIVKTGNKVKKVMVK